MSLRREVLIVLLAIFLSVLLLPGLIYAVGGHLFGPYGTAGGMGGLYRATLMDLWVPRLAAWALVLAPAICIALLRVIFRCTQPQRDESPPPPQARPLRKEPTINS